MKWLIFFITSVFASCTSQFGTQDSADNRSYAIPVVLTNLQATPTAANFEQSVIINSSVNSSLYAADLRNVSWQDASGNLLFSWLEGGETNTSAASAYWINLGTNVIAAGGSLTIYQIISPKGVNSIDGIKTGAEPNYTATYGQYDNGASVFTQYGGKSWSNFTFESGVWDTTHGYLEQTDTGGVHEGGPCALIESATYANNGSYIIETAMNFTGQAVNRVGILAVGSHFLGDIYGYRFMGQQTSNGPGEISLLNDYEGWVVNSTYAEAVATNYTLQIQNNAGVWSGALYGGFGLGGPVLTTMANTPYSAPNHAGDSSGYVGVGATFYNGTTSVGNPATFQWFRLRTLPPGAVMPSAVAGSVQLSP